MRQLETGRRGTPEGPKQQSIAICCIASCFVPFDGLPALRRLRGVRLRALAS
jgi:hypothetical protein